MKRSLPLMILALVVAAPAFGDESAIKLKDAQGKELVTSNCAACHSLDYVQMNSPFLDAKGWEATVNKMIKAMGAPIGQDDTRLIVDYLAKNYGK